MLSLENVSVVITDTGSITSRLHAKAGEMVLVHGASGGVRTILSFL